jgi:hypothetical protein
MYDRNWAKVDVNSVPRLATIPPGPNSQATHARVLVSALKAFGQRKIQAYLIGPDQALTPPPTIEFLEQWERQVQLARSRL